MLSFWRRWIDPNEAHRVRLRSGTFSALESPVGTQEPPKCAAGERLDSSRGLGSSAIGLKVDIEVVDSTYYM